MLNKNAFLGGKHHFSDYETRLSKSDEDNLDDDDDDEVNPAIEKAMNALKFVAQHVKNQDNFNSVSRQNEKIIKLASQSAIHDELADRLNCFLIDS